MHAEAKRKHPKGEAQEGPSEEASPAIKRARAWPNEKTQRFHNGVLEEQKN